MRLLMFTASVPALSAFIVLFASCEHKQLSAPSPRSSHAAGASASSVAMTPLDLREPMALAAQEIPPRLDPQLSYRPWFLLRGSNGIPTTAEHASWDLGDMTGRY